MATMLRLLILPLTFTPGRQSLAVTKFPALLSRDFSVGAAVGPIRGARAGWDGRLRQPVRCRVEPVARACDEQPANPPLSA